MWVQILTAKHISQNGGATRTYSRGDWLDVGKSTALAWLANGEARLFNIDEIKLGADCGIVTPQDAPAADRLLGNLAAAVAVQHGPVGLPYPKTLLWDGVAALRLDLLPAGFRFLDTWEVAAPLWSLDTLAADLGTEEQRAAVVGIVRELRVPVYDHRILFVRRGEAGRDVLTRWAEYAALGWEPRLALLAALYVVKPLLLALPPSWRRERGRG